MFQTNFDSKLENPHSHSNFSHKTTNNNEQNPSLNTSSDFVQQQYYTQSTEQQLRARLEPSVKLNM